MVIRDTPSDIEKYVMAEGELAFRLQQKGFVPEYMDFDAVYFLKTNKLLKVLKKLENEL